MLGILLFALSSALIVVAGSIECFLVLRLLQAIGGCAGMVVSRAMISDLLDEREAARFFSLMMVVSGIGPIVAPILGGYLISFAGWQAIFVFLTLLGLSCLVATQFMIPETLEPKAKQPLEVSAIVRTFGRLLVRRRFMIPTLLGSAVLGGIFAFISGAPFVYMQLYGVSKVNFGWVFGINAIGITLAAQANRMLLQRFSTTTLMQAGLLVHIGCAVLLYACAAKLSLPPACSLYLALPGTHSGHRRQCNRPGHERLCAGSRQRLGHYRRAPVCLGQPGQRCDRPVAQRDHLSHGRGSCLVAVSWVAWSP